MGETGPPPSRGAGSIPRAPEAPNRLRNEETVGSLGGWRVAPEPPNGPFGESLHGLDSLRYSTSPGGELYGWSPFYTLRERARQAFWNPEGGEVTVPVMYGMRESLAPREDVEERQSFHRRWDQLVTAFHTSAVLPSFIDSLAQAQRYFRKVLRVRMSLVEFEALVETLETRNLWFRRVEFVPRDTSAIAFNGIYVYGERGRRPEQLIWEGERASSLPPGAEWSEF